MENTNKRRSIARNIYDSGATLRPTVVWIKQDVVDRNRYKVMTHKEKVKYILQGSMEYLGIDKSYFETPRKVSKVFSVNKKYIVPVLYDYTKASFIEIAGLLGYKCPSNASYHYKQMKDELSDKMFGYDKTKMIYKELLMYLGIDSDGHIIKHINSDEEGTEDPKE